jgi:DNA modification methylase
VGREDEILKVERRKISELKNDPANARKHSPRNLKSIRDSLDVFGQQKPIVVDSRGVVIAGNGTLEAARELGWEEIDVAVTDLDPAHAQAFGIADNRTAELAEWDTDVLGQLLEGMDSDLADILSIDDLELPDSIDGGEQVEGLTDPDEVPEPPEEPITQTGDLWLLGEHRLLCGDSTSAEDVGRLMDGGKADMLLSDPPYGVSYVGKTKESLTVKNDELDESSLTELIRNAFNNAEAICRSGAYWFATVPPGPLHLLFAEDWKCRGILRQIMVWAKDSLVLGHSEYHYQHEPILFGWIAGDRHKNSDRTRTTLWEYDRPKASREHPTMKPVPLWAQAVTDGSRRGEVVYDPFLGSGTTLIAAEQLGRKCYGMEIDPKYCDVIVKRWEDFTGQTATRETASQTATRENERT